MKRRKRTANQVLKKTRRPKIRVKKRKKAKKRKRE